MNDLETYWTEEIGQTVEIKECHFLYDVAVSGENLGSFETLARVEIELERYWFLKGDAN